MVLYKQASNETYEDEKVEPRHIIQLQMLRAQKRHTIMLAFFPLTLHGEDMTLCPLMWHYNI